LKTRVQSLNQTLSQTNYQAADLQQKLGGIQNSVQSSEAERRVLQDKLEQARLGKRIRLILFLKS
jgi:hypothetical protein